MTQAAVYDIGSNIGLHLICLIAMKSMVLQTAVFRHISPGIIQSKSESNYTQMCI